MKHYYYYYSEFKPHYLIAEPPPLTFNLELITVALPILRF